MKSKLMWFTSALVIFQLFYQAKAIEGVSLREHQLIYGTSEGPQTFSLEFVVLYRETDPDMRLRPAGINNVKYNVPTWLVVDEGLADLHSVEREAEESGDGFDDRILEGSRDARSANYFSSALRFEARPINSHRLGNVIHFEYETHAHYTLKASVDIQAKPYPLLKFELVPKKDGYFSVGYAGAPSMSPQEVDEIWQPLIWQEKRFPKRPYLTLAYRTPLPTTLYRKGQSSFGVLAHPDEFPFDPLPLASNSRFGALLHNQSNQAQPMLFAPVMGGVESHMQAESLYKFSMYLVHEQAPSISYAYENIARKAFGFKDYRNNEIASLNTALDNIFDYTLSDYSWFVSELKGAAYSTDVPGAVKNVSSLNALELAMVMDSREMFETRAYPTIEFMLSREKFLFSLDPEQKIQSPSRELKGPIAPISELSALYNIFGKSNPFFVDLAKDEFQKSRIRNLEVLQHGDTWYNALWIYKSTGDHSFLERAIEGAERYLENRVNQYATSFDEEGFFWTQFTPKFAELLELYEVTNDARFLDAANQAARQYTMFTWMSPKIPEQDVLVNKGGLAPLYWYLKSKGHEQMYAPETFVEPWRLSEIGLTPESSGTSSGHRAIFMANYAPWLLRIGHHTNDDYLKEVAKAAIIGRYSNFPGYHINTARTTIYESPDYPLREHKQLSVNSFHYNHILPKASMLLDYLVTDVFVRSNGEIDFPSEYIEGYAYLQNKFYGHKKGRFYNENDITLWMPKGLLNIEDVELNYIAGYKGNDLYLAFTNQSKLPVKTNFTIDPERVHKPFSRNFFTWQDNVFQGEFKASGSSIPITVNGNGITVIKVEGVEPIIRYELPIIEQSFTIQNDHLSLEAGNAQAMLIKTLGDDLRAFIYLRDDDSKVSSLTISYFDENQHQQTLVDNEFPFELTVQLDDSSTSFEFDLKVVDIDNKTHSNTGLILGARVE